MISQKDLNWALEILKERKRISEELGEDKIGDSDYDEFVNDEYEALCIAIEVMKKSNADYL